MAIVLAVLKRYTGFQRLYAWGGSTVGGFEAFVSPFPIAVKYSRPETGATAHLMQGAVNNLTVTTLTILAKCPASARAK